MKPKANEPLPRAVQLPDVPAQDDPTRNPIGSIYSGPSKRVAISDGSFAPVRGIPKDTRNNGRLPRR
jgi:hypothetical protein